MFGELGNAIDAVIKFMFALLIIFVPLGLWKLIEIAVWLYSHFSISFN